MTSKLQALIVCTGYDEMSHVKDPGQIAAELQRRGYQVTCLTGRKGLAGRQFASWNIELLPELPGATRKWADYEADLMLVYFLDPHQSCWVSTIRQANPQAQLILKCDSDGLFGGGRCTPQSKAAQQEKDLIWFRELRDPRAMCQSPLWKTPLRIGARVAWGLTRHRFVSHRTIEQMSQYVRLFDKVVIESTEACRNLVLSIPEVEDQTVVVPDGVAATDAPTQQQRANNIVVVGRLTDHVEKRPLVAWRVLARFLQQQPDWTVDFIGPHDELLTRRVQAAPPLVQTRVHLLGSRPNTDVRRIMAGSSICFSTSASESFGIAMAEALTEGCSVVSTPVPSAWDLTAQGMSGTVADSFSERSLLAALETDACKWARNEYNPCIIADYWRRHLDWKTLIDSLLCETGQEVALGK